MILNSPYITGSITVTGNANVQGTLTVTGSLSGTATSASLALNSNLLQGTGSVGFSTTASLLAVSSSQQQISASLLNVIANYATTGSNSFRANQSITGSLVVSSTITAQTLVVQTVTSSIVYSSGSNIFGSALTDRQTFTGSLQVTGSSHNIFGNLGIGTKNPIALLHLSSSSSTAAYIHSTGTGNYASLNLTNNTTGYGYDVGFGGSTSIAPNCFYIYGGATASVKLAVASDGNIGIGTVIPSASLEVSGKVYVGGNTSNSNYQFLVKRGTDRNMGIGLQGTDLSIEFVNDIYTANVPTRIYANPLVLLGGNVGIGTISPDYPLTVQANSSAAQAVKLLGRSVDNISILSFHNNANSTQYGYVAGIPTEFRINSGTDIPITFTNLDTERMRITSAGNVGIGITSTNTNVKLKVKASSEGTDIGLSSSTLCIARTATDTQLNIGYYSTPDAFVISSTYGSDGAYKPLVFATSDTERMRIASVGSVSIGTATNTADIRLQVAASGGASPSWISATVAGTGDTDKVVIGNYTGKGPSIGGHNSALTGWAPLHLNFGGGAVYAGTLRIDNNSDQRFKRNITSVENALDTILKLQGRKFNMIDENNILRYGFVAQEVQPHLSDFVTESTREHKDENVHITNLLTLETSGAAWAALLVEAIKELKATNDSLQAQINELKER